MAAAFVLATLEHEYRDGFEGLVHATDWRSIGWTYIATTDLVGEEHTQHRRELLIGAIDRDPDNLLAQMALRYERRRDPDLDKDEKERELYLKQYGQWLQDQAAELGSGLVPLEARLLHTATAVELNRLVYEVPLCKRKSGAPPKRTTAMDRAIELFDVVDELEDGDPFKESLKPIVAVLILHAHRLPYDERLRMGRKLTAGDENRLWQWREGIENSVRAEYDDACRLVEQAADLRDLVKTPEFRRRYPEQARSDMLEIAPFEPLSERLREAGYTRPTALIDARITDGGLARYLGVTGHAVVRLQEAARLVDDIDATLDDFRYEIFAALWDTGVCSIGDLSKYRVEELTGTVETAAERRGLNFPRTDPPDRRNLEAWLEKPSRKGLSRILGRGGSSGQHVGREAGDLRLLVGGSSVPQH